MTYPEFIEEWSNDSLYIEQQTSGSTGIPKVISLSKALMARSADRSIQYFHIDPSWRLHSCISPDYIGGKMVAVRSILSKCEFTYETPSNTPVICGGECDVDLVSVVPSQMVYILDHPEEFRRVKRYLIGGAPLPYGMAEMIRDRHLEAWESYGMTETASHIALRHIGHENSFHPLPGIELSANQEQCLVIKGIYDEDIITNDLVCFTQDGGFNIIGRKDNVIISGGKKISPEGVEQKIQQILKLDEPIVLVGVPDPKWGQKIVLYVEGTPVSAAEARMMLQTLRANLEGWECPKGIYFVDSLARTPNGKILRKIP